MGKKQIKEGMIEDEGTSEGKKRKGKRDKRR